MENGRVPSRPAVRLSLSPGAQDQSSAYFFHWSRILQGWGLSLPLNAGNNHHYHASHSNISGPLVCQAHECQLISQLWE